MKFPKLIIPIATLVLLTTWQACKKDDKEDKDTFDRSALLTSIADHVLLPAHQQLATTAGSLTSATEVFVTTPNTANLATMQAEWQNMKVQVKDIGPFNFGPALDELVHNRIDKWPTNIAFIENFIHTEDTITSAFINSIGSTSVGLPAMEYLIFGPDGESAIIDSFTVSVYAEQRKQYLLSLALSLELAADILIDIWTERGDNYVADFKAATGNGLDGSVNILVNQLIAQTERTMRNHLLDPLEYSDPEQVEAPYAQTSLPMVRENVIAIRNTFNGGTNATDIGLDDYLDDVDAKYDGTPLSQTINGQIDLVLSKLDAIPAPLADAVVNSPNEVQDAADALRDLLALVKIDLASSLAVTVTFSDNDGD